MSLTIGYKIFSSHINISIYVSLFYIFYIVYQDRLIQQYVFRKVFVLVMVTNGKPWPRSTHKVVRNK